jgi:hypothetical protein
VDRQKGKKKKRVNGWIFGFFIFGRVILKRQAIKKQNLEPKKKTHTLLVHWYRAVQ